MNRELTEKILSMYVGRDPRRPTLCQFIPTEWDGKRWCCATEGHHFVMVPETPDNILPNPTGTTPNLASIMPTLKKGKDIEVDLLLETYECIPFVDEEVTIECGSCDGHGYFDHDGFTYECKRCDALGEVGTGRHQKVRDPATYLKVGVSHFDQKFIKTMLEVCKLTTATTVNIGFENEGTKSVFVLSSGIVVGIMPVIPKEDAKIIECP